MKKTNYPGIGLIFGTAIGAGLGIAINNIPIMAGIGCGIGIITGAIIQNQKQ